MEELKLETAEQIHDLFKVYRSHNGFGSWFRGQSDMNWPLLPKAGRSEFYLPHNRDLGRFNDWKNQAIAYSKLPSNDFECLALAQHHGFATRLLDWTQNPLVAVYFAVNSLSDIDGAIFILNSTEVHISSESELKDLEEFDAVICYIPRAISPRVLNQGGMFTIHCPPNRLIEVPNSDSTPKIEELIKVIIPKNIKTELLVLLDDYGINEAMLFPDLDGLSRKNNRYTSEIVLRNET